MTGTQISEALHAVADATAAPGPDRVAFQRLVRRERRHRTAGRVGLTVGLAAAAAVVVATTVVPFVRDGGAVDPAPAPGETTTVDLQMPVFLLLDGRLTALDPQGALHDLGLRVEEVIGYTSESVYAVGDDSGIVRFDVHHGDEGPASPWEFERVDSGIDGPVQSARLSADGRWIGWVDLEERLHVTDLKAGTTAEPVRLRGSGYLVDLAQGTGAALVVDDRGLVLLTEDGSLELPGGSPEATASRDRVAVPAGSGTVVHDVVRGRAVAVGEVPGFGRLSPYGELVASVSSDEGDASGTAWLAVPGGDPRRLEVGGRPAEVAWADDDTVLVSTWLDGAPAVFGCEVTDPSGSCTRLDVGTADRVTFAR